jgi:hypothetical protein
MNVVEPLHDLLDEAAALYLGEELATLYTKKHEELLIQPWGFYKEMPLA